MLVGVCCMCQRPSRAAGIWSLGHLMLDCSPASSSRWKTRIVERCHEVSWVNSIWNPSIVCFYVPSPRTLAGFCLLAHKAVFVHCPNRDGIRLLPWKETLYCVWTVPFVSMGWPRLPVALKSSLLVQESPRSEPSAQTESDKEILELLFQWAGVFTASCPFP